MAKQHGIPGESARIRGTMLSLWPLFVAFIFMGASIASIFTGCYTMVFATLFTASVILVALMWRKGVRRIESFFAGARGEELVARILAGLPEGWHVFNDFQTRRGRVDHVVIGPKGVFCIETKRWRGKITIEDGYLLVDGRLPSRSPVKQTLAEAASVRAIFDRFQAKIDISSILCFASDTFVDNSFVVSGVRVINSSLLAAWLLEQPQILGFDEVERLAKFIENGIGK